MQLWDFIFLSGSWESDQEKTGKTLTTLGRRSTKHEKPLALLLYPEGTLVRRYFKSPDIQDSSD